MKILINSCYGGFGLSQKAKDLYYTQTGSQVNNEDDLSFRTDSTIINIVESLGREADGTYAKLNIVNIPDESTDMRIRNYDGLETILYVIDGKICEEY